MMICALGHKTICFEGGPYTECPLCKVIVELDALYKKIDELQKEISEME